jgi:hypothetical protein
MPAVEPPNRDAAPPPAGAGAPAILDIEASGFGRRSYPIEVGCVLASGESYCSLIRPVAGWTHWDPQAEQLHQIAQATVARHGRSVQEVATQLNRMLRGQTVYCDGWAHDYAWLHALFDAAELVPTFKLDNLRALLTDEEAAHWGALKQSVAVASPSQRHRASTDARLLQQALLRLRGP